MRASNFLSRRLFLALSAVMLTALALVEYLSVRSESPTYDEPNQLMTGFGFWKLGRYTAGIEHPPLAKLLLTAPLVGLDLDLPASFPRETVDISNPDISKVFLFHNRVDADVILRRGRMVAITFSLMFGLTVALWTRRWFGPVAGLMALSLYCLDPNLTAHGRYAKNDVAAAWTIFLAAACWTEYLISKSRRWLWMSGLALGVALATKFSALVLLPAYPLLALYARSHDRKFPALKSLLVVALGSVLVIFCSYKFQFESLQSAGFTSSALPSAVQKIPLPAADFVRGLKSLGHKEVQGQSLGYLLGELSDSGWWYFPFVVLAVKMPLGVTLLTIITIGLVLYRRDPIALPSLRVAGMTLPVVLYFGASMITSQNAGIRHMLPLLPFLYMALGWFWAKRLEQPSTGTIAMLTICGVLLAAENIFIYPHYLAFFNIASGGPKHGPEYLVDSNLDWGQDAKNLAQYLSGRHVQEPCVSYFGMAEPDHYGIQARPVPPASTAQQVNAIDCLVAVSASFLYRPDGMFDGLRQRQPDARIGYSIYVYDLRKQN